jgi:hypothetical protein
MQNLAYCPQKLVALWAFSCALAFSPSVNGQNTENGVPAPCPTTATNGSAGQTNSVLAAEKQNLQNAGRQLGALFKKKPASTAAAPADPCPATAPAPAAAPGATANSARPAANSQPIVSGGGNWTGPFTPPAGTGIVPLVVGPYSQGSQIEISPGQVHLASLVPNGSKWSIIVDGKVGPKVDHVFNQGDRATGVTFSPDSNHYAYCALMGSDYVVILDGKEIFRDSKGDVGGVIDDSSCGGIRFSANSRHLYFTSSIAGEANHAGTAMVRFVWDGTAGPGGAGADYRDFGFSPDGEHFAYHWFDPSNSAGPERLFVDGKMASYNGDNLQWSGDSQHLYSINRITQPKAEWDVLMDGKPILKTDTVMLYAAPIGPMMVAKVTRASGIPNPYQFLVAGGKAVSPNFPGGSSIGDVVFSVDGKHYAAIVHDSNGRASVFTDGKRGETYARFDPFSIWSYPVGPQSTVAFTADGSKVVYVGDNASGSQFLVLGDQESDAIHQLTWVAIAPVGNHVMAAGYNQIVLDGKMLPTFPGQIFQPQFNSDGSHYAYVVQNSNGPVVYLDGAPQSAYTAYQANGSYYTFSPDGRHIAYFCHSASASAGNEEGVCLDGKYMQQGQGNALSNLTFSSDSNHLFWNFRQGPNVRIFADNKPVLDGGAPSVGFQAQAWQPDGKSGLVILVHDGDSFKRVTITPASSSSVAGMLGGGPAVASAH